MAARPTALDRHTFALREIIRCTGTVAGPQELLDRITGIIATALDADRVGVFELVTDEPHAVLRAGVGWDRGAISHAVVPTGPGSAADRVLGETRPMVIAGAAVAEGPDAHELLAGHHCESGCAVRIDGPGAPFGYLIVARLTPEPLTAPELEVVTAAAEAAGLMLERLQAELMRSDAELRVVLDNLATGVVVVNADGKLRYANDAAARAGGLQTAAQLCAIDEHELRSRFRFFDEYGRELPRELRPRARALRGERLDSMLLRMVGPIDAEKWFQVRATPVIEEHGQVELAVITFDEVSELKRSEESLRRSEEVHRRIGHVLQRGLQAPAMPEIPSVELAVRLRTVGEQALIGGDFHDAFAVGGDRWMIVIGDITGKGVEAAAFTALVRYTIRAAGVRDKDPSAALAQLNGMLIDDPAHPRLCTAVCALIEPGPPVRVTVARGGHPPPLLLAGTQPKPVRIEPEGPVLGAFEGARFQTAPLELDSGDALVLYTDGVSEAGARSGGGALDLEGIEERLIATRGESAETIASAIDAAAAACDGARQRDDALVVVIRGR